MSFRKPKTEARDALRRRDFRAEERELFEDSGLPGAIADRRVFAEFLKEGFLEMLGGLADGTAFDLDELDQNQQAALGRLVSRSVVEFGDPGLTGAIARLQPN